MKDKLEFKLIELQQMLDGINHDLVDKENLTIGQIARMNVERAKVKFAIQILKEIQND
jgi:hypothetical protein